MKLVKDDITGEEYCCQLACDNSYVFRHEKEHLYLQYVGSEYNSDITSDPINYCPWCGAKLG